MNEPAETGSGRSDQAFVNFYRREHVGQVRRAALIVGDRDLADDLVQDAFVALYRRWEAVDAPGAYLSIVVLNACRDATRRAGRHRAALARHVAGIDLSVPGADSMATNEALWCALADLPFRQRAATVLRFYEHRTEAEIATALGCRPGTVGPLITRSLRTLRKRLDDSI